VSRLRRSLLGIIPHLEAAGARWAVVGGLAVGARSVARFTADLDLAIAVASDREAEGLLLRLQRAGYEIASVLEHEPSGRIATVRLRPPGESADSLFVDLLFASAGIEPEIVAAAEPASVFPGISAPIARTGHLIAMKLLAKDERRRPADFDDLEALIANADEAELARARESTRLIGDRGHARGRDLPAELESWLAQKRPQS
jgi:hypothetical protein